MLDIAARGLRMTKINIAIRIWCHMGVSYMQFNGTE